MGGENRIFYNFLIYEIRYNVLVYIIFLREIFFINNIILKIYKIFFYTQMVGVYSIIYEYDVVFA